MNKISIFNLLIFIIFCSINAGNDGSKTNQTASDSTSMGNKETSLQTSTQSMPPIKKAGGEGPEMHIHVNVNNLNTTSSESKSESTSKASNYVSIQQHLQITAADLLHSTKSFFSTYKWPLALTTPIIFYLGICTLLVRGNRLIHNQASWALWKHHLSVEELRTYCLDDNKKTALMHNLIDAILNSHFNINEPTNHISPLVQFITTVDHEMKLINHYLFVAKILKVSRLIALFPTNETKIERAQECKQRLQFIKQLFVAWTATYNLHQFLHPHAPLAAEPNELLQAG